MTFPGPTSPFPLPFIKTDFPLFLAPMAGVTDPIFRTICKELGADVMVTEFVSAEGILQAWERNRRYTKIEESHRPIGIQLFGADGAHMGEAARIILDHEKPDFIDINFGCPVPKVVGKNGGSSLLKDLPLLASVAAGVVKAVGDRIPVTAKIRIGWDFQNLCAMDACRLLEDAGISMITIHGRTRAQMYTGEADWTLIGEVKNNPRMHIPIIGNGDVTTPQRAKECFDRYGVDAVMIGRASFGRPWIFKEVKHYLETGEEIPPLSSEWKLNVLRQEVEDSVKLLDERRGILHVRRHLAASPLFKGIPNFRETRIAMLRAETKEELYRIFNEIEKLI